MGKITTGAYYRYFISRLQKQIKEGILDILYIYIS